MEKSPTPSLASSAGKVSLATAFSRVLGLIREQVVAYFFGAGMATDAFIAAFRVPNLLRDLFAEGALSSAFIPVFKEKMVNEGKAAAFRLANVTISILLLVVGAVICLGIIFAPQIIYITANGFTEDPQKFTLTVTLTQIMFVYLMMVSISAVIMGILNSVGRFGIPALSPALFNIGMIMAPFLLIEYFSVPIYTLAIGVLIGGIGQLVFQLPSLFKIGFRFAFIFDLADKGLRRIVRLITPMIMGLSASRINIVINTLLASMLIQGSISYLNYAYRLMHFPLGVFAVALGTVTLPKVSEDAAQKRIDQLAATYDEAMGLTMFLVVPSAVYLAGFGTDLVRLIFERGAFSAEATMETSRALFFYAFGLVGFAGVRVAAPVFYALGDSRRPMYYSITAVLVNIILNFVFIPIWGFAGLAAATSAAGLANIFLLGYNIRKRVPEINYADLLWRTLKITIAAALAFLAIYHIKLDSFIAHGDIWGKTAVVLLEIFGMGLVYLILCRFFRIQEIYHVKDIFKFKK